MDVEKGQDLLRDRTEWRGDLVARERRAALNTIDSFRSGRVKNLAGQDGRIVAGVDCPGWRAEKRRKISGALRIGWQRGDIGRALIVPVLLP